MLLFIYLCEDLEGKDSFVRTVFFFFPSAHAETFSYMCSNTWVGHKIQQNTIKTPLLVDVINQKLQGVLSRFLTLRSELGLAKKIRSSVPLWKYPAKLVGILISSSWSELVTIWLHGNGRHSLQIPGPSSVESHILSSFKIRLKNFLILSSLQYKAPWVESYCDLVLYK